MYQRIDQAQAAPVSNWTLEFGRLQTEYKNCRLAPDSNYARILFGLGYAYSLTEQFDQAYQLTQQSIKINASGSPAVKPKDLAKYYYYLGYYLEGLDRYTDAIDAYKKSVQLGRNQLNYTAIVSQSLKGLAFQYYRQGDYEEALTSADLGYTYAAAGNDRLVMSACLYTSARSLARLDKTTLAEKQIRLAIQLVTTLPDAESEKNIYTRVLAELLFLKNQPAEGLKLYQELIQVYGKQQNTDEAAWVYNDIGYQYFSVLKDYAKALRYFGQAYKRYVSPYEKANTLSNIALVYAEQKNYPMAIRYMQKSLVTFPIGFKEIAVTINPNRNQFHAASSNEKLLSIIQAKADVWLDYAKATKNPQRLHYALDTYKVADQIIDIMRWEHTGQLSKLYWREKTRVIYERAIETCYCLNNTDQAFRFFEKSRAAMLSDKLNELGANRQLSPQQVAEEQRLQQHVSSQQAKLAGIKPTDSLTYKTAQRTLDNEQENLDAFRKKLETSNPAYYRYKYDTTVTSLTDLRSHLKNQQASFVTYFVGDSTLYVLGVTADTTLLIRQPLRSYQSNIQMFMALLGNPEAMNRKANRDQFLGLGNRLYTQLLAPLKLPAGRVIVSPDGSFVPFETLSRKVNEPDYLVNDYAFSYTYSARLLLKKTTDSVSKHHMGKFLGIAPVTFAPSLMQVMLPGSEEALERIAKRFHAPEQLTHQAATRRAFLTKAADASIIQLFTHATADSSGQEPMLFFADSTLKLSDLGDGSLPNAQLVVLAACKTGVGAVQRGEGVFSLARGFAALGVPSVLTTLWSVQNDATYQLTDLFFNYVDKGFPKDIALQRAKQDWLKTADLTNQMPNFWAGLIVVGDTEPLEQTNYGLWIAVSTLLIFAGFGAWFWQRKKKKARPEVSLPHSV